MYVDGFLLPVPGRNLRKYAAISKKAGKIWREHGAIEYLECVGDDLRQKGTATFKRMTRIKGGEKVLFSWIVYKSRAHRDRVVDKVMKDPRLADMMKPEKTPFDVKRMAYGGFKPLVKV